MVELSLDIARFRFQCLGASWVCLAGDFNDWSTSATPMRQVRRGVWRVDLRLKPGDYRFRYFTSHRGWLTDWAAFGVERNPFGDWNSVLHVPAHRQTRGGPDAAGLGVPGFVEVESWDQTRWEEAPDSSLLAPSIQSVAVAV